MEKMGPVHFDKKPMMAVYGNALDLQLRLAEGNPLSVPTKILNDIDAVVLKVNKYVSRLDKAPQFSELPFVTKAKILEPMSEIRIAALNLKRAAKACLEAPKAPQKPGAPQSTAGIPAGNLSVMVRGFL